MNVGQVITLGVDGMSFGPAAVGRYTPPGEARAMVVFINGALPGEKVEVKLTKNHKSYWDGELVRVLEPSPDRITPPCPVFGRCGGCQWQHLSYPAQLRAKEQVLLHQLSRATRLAEAELKGRLDVHPAANPFGYRARLQVHGDKRGIGFFANHTHKIVRTDRCLVAHADIQKEWGGFLRTRPLADLAKATGQFKVEWTRNESGQVLEAINRKHGAFGFTQVNPEQNAVLTKVVAEAAGPGGEVLLDLYGGDGNLSNALVERFTRIVSVDSFNDGADPVAPGALPATGRVFIRESVEDFLLNQRWRDWGIDRIDCVIADPPRNGLREASDRISGINAPRIILVSCDPSTLARDLNAFTAQSAATRYQVERIHLIDMFPQTYHMETVVELRAV